MEQLIFMLSATLFVFVIIAIFIAFGESFSNPYDPEKAASDRRRAAHQSRIDSHGQENADDKQRQLRERYPGWKL